MTIEQLEKASEIYGELRQLEYDVQQMTGNESVIRIDFRFGDFSHSKELDFLKEKLQSEFKTQALDILSKRVAELKKELSEI